MIGKDPRFSPLKVKPFNLPRQIDKWDLELQNERHFIEFLLRNEWVQRMTGIKMSGSNGLFPDVKGELFDEFKTKIDVEVEYWAENYKEHGHRFGGCHLILSLFRKPTTRIIRGVPVWSFYTGQKSSRFFKYCLKDDINYNFDSHIEHTAKKAPPSQFIFDGKEWIQHDVLLKKLKKGEIRRGHF